MGSREPKPFSRVIFTNLHRWELFIQLPIYFFTKKACTPRLNRLYML